MKKVFKITPSLSYGGGCALVAADTMDEAESIFRDDEYHNYIFEDYNCKIKEVRNLYCDTDDAKLIFNHIYVE